MLFPNESIALGCWGYPSSLKLTDIAPQNCSFRECTTRILPVLVGVPKEFGRNSKSRIRIWSNSQNPIRNQESKISPTRPPGRWAPGCFTNSLCFGILSTFGGLYLPRACGQNHWTKNMIKYFLQVNLQDYHSLLPQKCNYMPPPTPGDVPAS